MLKYDLLIYIGLRVTYILLFKYIITIYFTYIENKITPYNTTKVIKKYKTHINYQNIHRIYG